MSSSFAGLDGLLNTLSLDEGVPMDSLPNIHAAAMGMMGGENVQAVCSAYAQFLLRQLGDPTDERKTLHATHDRQLF